MPYREYRYSFMREDRKVEMEEKNRVKICDKKNKEIRLNVNSEAQLTKLSLVKYRATNVEHLEKIKHPTVVTTHKIIFLTIIPSPDAIMSKDEKKKNNRKEG